jgi:hypothetical protein
MTQLTLQLEPGVGAKYRTLKECVASGVYQRGVVAVAGKIDKQPSHLSEALSGSERRKFDIDDLERFVATTGDVTPILYLIDRFLSDPTARQQEAMAKLAELAESLPAILAAAGIETATRGRRR